MTIYKFRNCFLNTVERRVVRDGKYLDLSPKTFDVLHLLVERTGDIVTKDELLGSVWNGSFVEENNLPVHISKLRRSLDATGAERFIETVQGSGYRFIAPVVTAGEDEWLKQLAGNKRRQTDSLPAGLAFDSIAVLPLQNESNNPEIDYLADGLTESFINSLSRVPDLRVMARDTVFRYKNKNTDAKEVGETLGVAAVLTGRIKAIRDRLMISVELVKVADGSQLWGTRFDQPFSDIIQIQEEITLAVSERLRSEITGAAAGSPDFPFTQNSESYRLYLKGKFFQGKRSEAELYTAIEYFKKSISYDPVNVHSYVEAVESYFLLYLFDLISYDDVLAKIEPLVDVIRGLNQSVDIVQNMYGGLKLYLEWRFDQAGHHLRRALSINPNCLFANYRYSEFLLLSGRFSEALDALQKIMIIDPLSTLTYKRIGRMLWKIGRYESSMVYLQDAIEIEEQDYEALVLLGAVFTELGRYSEALTVFQLSNSIHENVETLSMIGYVHALEGRRDAALAIVRQIRSGSTGGSNRHAIKLARIHAALGENALCYRYLDEARSRNEVDLRAVSYDPRWRHISQEPRFREFVSNLGLPANK